MKHGFKHGLPPVTTRQALTKPRRHARCSDAPGSLKHSHPHRERSLENLLRRNAPSDGQAHRLALDRTLAARLGRRLRRLARRLYDGWLAILHFSVGDLKPLSKHFRARLSSAGQPGRNPTQPDRDANN